jgi:hypothetical protein
MKIHRRNKNLIVSILILSACICMAFLLFYPGSSGLGNFFNLAVLLIFTYYLAVGGGIILLLLRVLKWLKDKYSLIYILTGAFNLFLACVGICLYFMHKAGIDWLHNSLGNLFVAFLVLTDVFILPANAGN